MSDARRGGRDIRGEGSQPAAEALSGSVAFAVDRQRIQLWHVASGDLFVWVGAVLPCRVRHLLEVME